MIGYKKIGTGDICEAMINIAMIISNKTMGIIQILFDFLKSLNSCLIDENIVNITCIERNIHD